MDGLLLGVYGYTIAMFSGFFVRNKFVMYFNLIAVAVIICHLARRMLGAQEYACEAAFASAVAIVCIFANLTAASYMAKGNAKLIMDLAPRKGNREN